MPEQWVKSGSVIDDHGYRKTCSSMQSKQTVVDSGELKLPKFKREKDLFNRKVNITNQCLCHTCSSYCSVMKTVNRKYDNDKDSERGESEIRMSDKGQLFVDKTVKECRFKFGKMLDFDPSGEGNLTSGRCREDSPRVEPDANGMMRYIGRRNHPRTVQTPYSAHFFGANNDLQMPLINTAGKMYFREVSSEEYLQYSNNVYVAGFGGLEYSYGSHCFSEYATKYVSKGGYHSLEWKDTVDQITAAYCDDNKNVDKTLRSLMGKQMNVITQGVDTPKDQALYQLGGGKLKRLSLGTPLSCSFNSVLVDEVGVSNDQGGPVDTEIGGAIAAQNKFNWDNIRKRYIKRNEDLHHLNLYNWIVNHWKNGKKVVPQFLSSSNLGKRIRTNLKMNMASTVMS